MPDIQWDFGTAYDFIISLLVLHRAGTFGLRPSWAAGVRQRLTAPRRDFLEKLYAFGGIRLDWVSSLPQPKNAADLLEQAARLDPVRRFEVLALPADLPAVVRQALHKIHSRHAATAEEREILRTQYLLRGSSLRHADLEKLVNACLDMESSGNELLAALQEYQQVFFAEEENRLRPALEEGLHHARDKSAHMTVEALIEDLSHGIRLGDLAAVRTLILAPSYWTSPLVYLTRPRANQALIIFGVRPAFESIIPGDRAPEMLIAALKALADPTRLHILRYLNQGPLQQAELARRLRLRPPTVTHHLQALRLAGLVQITINERHEQRYAARPERLDELGISLREFISTREYHE